MDKLFLNPPDVRALLNEGKTLFYGPTGSYHHPLFPSPVQRPGRKKQWYRPAIEQFGAVVAAQYSAGHIELPPVTALPKPAVVTRGRGRPRKPRPFALARG